MLAHHTITLLFLTLCLLFASRPTHADIIGYACSDLACNKPVQSYEYNDIINATQTILPAGTYGWKALKKGGRVCRDTEGDCTGCNAGNWHTGCWPSGNSTPWFCFCSL